MNENTSIEQEGTDIEAFDNDAGADNRPGPLRAIRRHCVTCCNDSSHEVAVCISASCPLWLFRFGRKPGSMQVAEIADRATHPTEQPLTQGEVTGLSRLKAVRRRCLDCSGHSPAEVRGCRQTGCDLYLFRMGKGNRTMSDTQRAAAAERLAAYRTRTALLE